eukprot:1388771-Prymnesium_polylepis.3
MNIHHRQKPTFSRARHDHLWSRTGTCQEVTDWHRANAQAVCIHAVRAILECTLLLLECTLLRDIRVLLQDSGISLLWAYQRRCAYK